jgi:hypothetical protein
MKNTLRVSSISYFSFILLFLTLFGPDILLRNKGMIFYFGNMELKRAGGAVQKRI